MALCHYYPCPEEIDVFTGPHMRMKQLVYEALEKVSSWNIIRSFYFKNRGISDALHTKYLLSVFYIDHSACIVLAASLFFVRGVRSCCTNVIISCQASLQSSWFISCRAAGEFTDVPSKLATNPRMTRPNTEVTSYFQNTIFRILLDTKLYVRERWWTTLNL